MKWFKIECLHNGVAKDCARDVTLCHGTSSLCDILKVHVLFKGARGGVMFKALRYKPAGRGFSS